MKFAFLDAIDESATQGCDVRILILFFRHSGYFNMSWRMLKVPCFRVRVNNPVRFEVTGAAVDSARIVASATHVGNFFAMGTTRGLCRLPAFPLRRRCHGDQCCAWLQLRGR